jgi:hypothetical protein
MNVANMKPCGMSSSFGLRAGVQRNTKVYIEPSNRDCMAPSNAIFSSDPMWNVNIKRTSKEREIEKKKHVDRP